MDTQFYTIAEFAKVLKISIPTVKRWIKSGKIKVLRVGRVVRIPKEEIDRLMSEGTK